MTAKNIRGAMPRVSAAALATYPQVDGRLPTLSPPAGLTNQERALFEEIIASADSRYFVASDVPLLVSFVQATLMVRRTVNRPTQINVWEKAVRVQALLATKLRLTPRSRMSPETAARRAAGSANPAVQRLWD
jgi:hypothetical protein